MKRLDQSLNSLSKNESKTSENTQICALWQNQVHYEELAATNMFCFFQIDLKLHFLLFI